MNLPICYSYYQVKIAYFNFQWSCRPPCKISCSFPDTEVISPKMHFGEVGPTYYIDETVARVGESTDLTEINNIVGFQLFM